MYFLFHPKISFFQWLVMQLAIWVAYLTGLSTASLLWFVGIIVIGATVEVAVKRKARVSP